MTVVGGAADNPGKYESRYAAFISYSHADEEFGDWLHRRLESYRVPAALVGRDGPGGRINRRLGKVFRDRTDLSAAHDLSAEIREGLKQSDALIVLCSPRACGSKYVNEEIRFFKVLGKGQRIFAAIVDGEPHAAGNPRYTNADECFPPALIYQLDDQGALSSTPEPNEPLAADFRGGKDGCESGSLKLIAGLLEVGLDELVQRERQAQRRRQFIAYGIAACMSVLAIGAIGAGGIAVWQWQEAVASEAAAVESAERALRAQRIAEHREREALDANALAAQRQRDLERVAQGYTATFERAFSSVESVQVSGFEDLGPEIPGDNFALVTPALAPSAIPETFAHPLMQLQLRVNRAPMDYWERVGPGMVAVFESIQSWPRRGGASSPFTGQQEIETAFGDEECATVPEIDFYDTVSEFERRTTGRIALMSAAQRQNERDRAAHLIDTEIQAQRSTNRRVEVMRLQVGESCIFFGYASSKAL